MEMAFQTSWSGLTAGFRSFSGMAMERSQLRRAVPSPYPDFRSTLHPWLRDFNGDGIPDFAAFTTQGVIVCLGNGDGTFKTAIQTGSAF